MKTSFMHAIKGRRRVANVRFRPFSGLRLLPALIFFGSLFLTLKIGLIWRDADTLVNGEGFAIAGALARSGGAAPAAHAAPETPAAHAAPETPAAHAAPETPAAHAAPENKSGEKDAAASHASPSHSKANASAKASVTAPKRPDAPAFTPGEVDVLRQLAKRREELDARASELDKRDAMMRAAESRIDAKVEALKDLQQRVSAAIKTHDSQQDAKLASLVKLYETMKPKDAAAIFEALDLETLLLVAERMKERKLAPIMANMKPAKARDVTIRLVKLRKIDAPDGASGTSGSASGRRP